MRELTFAAGGPWWCSAACASTRPAPPRRGCDLDVLHGHLRVLLQPLDEVAAQPARPLRAREGRDDDLVDPLVVESLHRGRVRIGMRHLPVDVEALAAQERRRCGAGACRRRGAARRSGRSAARGSGSSPATPGALADPVQELVADDGLVGDDEHVGGAAFPLPGRRRRARRGSCPPPSGCFRRRPGAASRSCPRDGSRRRSPPAAARAGRTSRGRRRPGPTSTTKPCAAMPCERSRSSVLSSRRRAEARRVSS